MRKDVGDRISSLDTIFCLLIMSRSDICMLGVSFICVTVDNKQWGFTRNYLSVCVDDTMWTQQLLDLRISTCHQWTRMRGFSNPRRNEFTKYLSHVISKISEQTLIYFQPHFEKCWQVSLKGFLLLQKLWCFQRFLLKLYF